MNRLFFQPHQAGLSKVQAAEDTLRYDLQKWVRSAFIWDAATEKCSTLNHLQGSKL